MSIEVKVAVGVGEKFAIVKSADVKHILLKSTGIVVNVDGECYPLYKGISFKESQKVDDLFDTGRFEELDIDKYNAQKMESEYDVTVTRYGCVKVRASSAMEAMEKANKLPTESIVWNEDWSATDAYRE